MKHAKLYLHLKLEGQKIGHLTVLKKHGSDGKTLWLVKCDCGSESVKVGSELTKMLKRKKMCGCSHKCPMTKEILRQKQTTHSKSKHPLYAVWRSMKRRCYAENHPAWPNYGGRGIKVCDRWLESFCNFWEDVSPLWREGMDIDRINNDGHYEPGNVRAATRQRNCMNRRNSITNLGFPEDTYAQLKKAGIAQSTFHYRRKSGWTWQQIISTKPDPRNRRSTTSSTADQGTASL